MLHKCKGNLGDGHAEQLLFSGLERNLTLHFPCVSSFFCNHKTSSDLGPNATGPTVSAGRHFCTKRVAEFLVFIVAFLAVGVAMGAQEHRLLFPLRFVTCPSTGFLPIARRRRRVARFPRFGRANLRNLDPSAVILADNCPRESLFSIVYAAFSRHILLISFAVWLCSAIQLFLAHRQSTESLKFSDCSTLLSQTVVLIRLLYPHFGQFVLPVERRVILGPKDKGKSKLKWTLAPKEKPKLTLSGQILKLVGRALPGKRLVVHNGKDGECLADSLRFLGHHVPVPEKPTLLDLHEVYAANGIYVPIFLLARDEEGLVRFFTPVQHAAFKKAGHYSLSVPDTDFLVILYSSKDQSYAHACAVRVFNSDGPSPSAAVTVEEEVVEPVPSVESPPAVPTPVVKPVVEEKAPVVVKMAEPLIVVPAIAPTPCAIPKPTEPPVAQGALVPTTAPVATKVAVPQSPSENGAPDEDDLLLAEIPPKVVRCAMNHARLILKQADFAQSNMVVLAQMKRSLAFALFTEKYVLSQFESRTLVRAEYDLVVEYYDVHGSFSAALRARSSSSYIQTLLPYIPAWRLIRRVSRVVDEVKEQWLGVDAPHFTVENDGVFVPLCFCADIPTNPVDLVTHFQRVPHRFIPPVLFRQEEVARTMIADDYKRWSIHVCRKGFLEKMMWLYKAAHRCQFVERMERLCLVEQEDRTAILAERNINFLRIFMLEQTVYWRRDLHLRMLHDSDRFVGRPFFFERKMPRQPTLRPSCCVDELTRPVQLPLFLEAEMRFARKPSVVPSRALSLAIHGKYAYLETPADSEEAVRLRLIKRLMLLSNAGSGSCEGVVVDVGAPIMGSADYDTSPDPFFVTVLEPLIAPRTRLKVHCVHGRGFRNCSECKRDVHTCAEHQCTYISSCARCKGVDEWRTVDAEVRTLRWHSVPSTLSVSKKAIEDAPQFGAVAYGPTFNPPIVVAARSGGTILSGFVNRSVNLIRSFDNATFEKVWCRFSRDFRHDYVKAPIVEDYVESLKGEQRNKMRRFLPAFKQIQVRCPASTMKKLHVYTVFQKREKLDGKRKCVPGVTEIEIAQDEPAATFGPDGSLQDLAAATIQGAWRRHFARGHGVGYGFTSDHQPSAASSDLTCEPMDIRVISYLHPIANLFVGPMVQAWYHRLKSKFSVTTPRALGSGLDPVQIGKWMEQVPSHYAFIETDASRFDGHQHASWFRMLKLLAGHTTFLDNNRRNVLRSIALQTNSLSLLPDKSKMVSEGVMKSGSMFTTLLNSLVNLYMLDFAVIGFRQVFIIVSGDDGLIACHPDEAQAILASVQRVTALLGHKYKCAERTRNNASFLSSQFWPVVATKGDFSTEWMLMPRLGKFLSKFGWSLEIQPDPKGWLEQNKLAAFSLFRGRRSIQRIFGVNKVVSVADRNTLRSIDKDYAIEEREDLTFSFAAHVGVEEWELKPGSMGKCVVVDDPVLCHLVSLSI